MAAAAIAALLLPLSANPLQTLVANGDTRTLTFAHLHVDETLTVTFKRNGRYDEAALKQLNWFLRDWRRDEATAMDPHLFDLLWEIQREVGASGPITIVSGYRSPQTNSMLRARGRGVARFSQHMAGKAIDFYIPGADLADLRAVGLRLQRGGVGFYPSSGSPFIHVDTGGVRHWPRLTRDQLAKIFPDGKTVHIPADGKPMPGFALAMAEIEARGRKPGAVALAMREEAVHSETAADGADRQADDGGRLTRLIASLFGRHKDQDGATEAGSSSPRTRIPTATASAPAGAEPASPARRTLAAVPAPKPTSEKTTLVAALAPASPLPRPRPAELADVTASPTPALADEAPRSADSVLAYAPAPERWHDRFGPLPVAHARLALAAEPMRAPATMLADGPPVDARLPLATPPADRPPADAARPPAVLFGAATLEQVAELHHPDLAILHGLVQPVRAALRVQFARDSVAAPSSFRFSGPAVVALQILAFDRGAGIITGALASRVN